MKKSSLVVTLLLSGLLYAANGFCDTPKVEVPDGAKAFEKHCAICHFNHLKSNKTTRPLREINFSAGTIRNEKDIVNKIRYIGLEMTKFNERDISNEEAAAIAGYVFKNFK